MIYTLEELAAHHQATGSVVSRYVPESDYKKLQQERNELAATVETLSQHTSLVLLERARKEKNEALSALHAYKDFLMHINDCLSKNGEYAPLSRLEINNLIAATPQQHLRDVEAEAGRAGFIACYEQNKVSILYSENIERRADNYAASVKAGQA